MNPKEYKKGEHKYVDWGKGIKEVKKVTEKNQPREIKINVDNEMALGKYASLCSILHKDDEFLFDFMFMPPGTNEARVVSRVITSPAHAKRLNMALMDNIKKYEKKYGEIKLTERPDQRIGF
ncbi:DUF3467 domain-containing protein [Elusimicrobiota bacterium]